jgi:hypothetical protein
MFRANAWFGNGTTADAVRQELETDLRLDGTIQSGRARLAIESLTRRSTDPSFSQADKAIAKGSQGGSGQRTPRSLAVIYDDVLPLLERHFPEWWDGHLAEFREEGSGGAHMAAGTLVSLIDEAMRLGDKSYAARAAALGDALADSADPRVENVLYVSFLENMDHLDRGDLLLIAGMLGNKSRAMLSEMVSKVDEPTRQAGSRR